jgi:hypothetical protein
MANRNEYVDGLVPVMERDGGNKKYVTIKIEYNVDTNQLYLNDAPMNLNQKANWIGMARFVMQALERFSGKVVRD